MEEKFLCEECDIKDEEKKVKKKCEHRKQKHTCKDCNKITNSDDKITNNDDKITNNDDKITNSDDKITNNDDKITNSDKKIKTKKCEHDKIKYICRICNPKVFCEHDKFKRQCKECGCITFCEHKKQKSNCKECDGSGICEHKKQKSNCKECDGSEICEHKKQKSNCKEYEGSILCKSTWCEKYANKKYEGYCLFCYVNIFPDKQITINYKTKEKDVVDRILKLFPDFTWIADKKVQDGCSKRRHDLLLDIGTHIIIVEIDDNAHTNHDCSCENKRLMEISQDLGFRPIASIRFNPDDYVNMEGKKIKSCWKLNRQTGLLVFDVKKNSEYVERINSLVEQIKYWVKNPTEKTIEIIELFY